VTHINDQHYWYQWYCCCNAQIHKKYSTSHLGDRGLDLDLELDLECEEVSSFGGYFLFRSISDLANSSSISTSFLQAQNTISQHITDQQNYANTTNS